MTSRTLTVAERLKFLLLDTGLSISGNARKYLADVNDSRPLTPADYASTSGLILLLDDDVWVNAPITDYNPNFVADSPYVLDVDSDGLIVHGEGLMSPARFCPPPDYHGKTGTNGNPYNYYTFSHGDRVRLAPIMGCAMVCKFCNIPYEDRYGTKPEDALLEAIGVALNDPFQPARHMLISGGTPHDDDIGYLRDVYEKVLVEFPDLEVDIMMVPIDGLLDLTRLKELGVHELSINIELYNRESAARIMRQKYGRGLDWYLDFLENATGILGPRRVRSMLLVGLESAEDTLAGVKEILDRGCVPVLSPFRPDPSTPMRDVRPPSAAEMEDVYMRAFELCVDAGSALGPDCPPCSHNTLTLASGLGDGGAVYRHPMPNLV